MSTVHGDQRTITIMLTQVSRRERSIKQPP